MRDCKGWGGGEGVAADGGEKGETLGVDGSEERFGSNVTASTLFFLRVPREVEGHQIIFPVRGGRGCWNPGMSS